MTIFEILVFIVAATATVALFGAFIKITYDQGHAAGYNKACDDILQDITEMETELKKIRQRPQETKPWDITR